MDKFYAGCVGYFIGAAMFFPNPHPIDYMMAALGIGAAIALALTENSP
jgi:hypothetical protein